MSDGGYCYPPEYAVLKNRLNLRDADELERVERRIVTQRSVEVIPSGDFDLAHMRAIHRHLFQDLYDWAGQIRTVEISKGASRFQFRRFIESGMADVHGRLVRKNFLTGLDAGSFAVEAAGILGDVNYVHPFREGNGRTQMIYLRQLSERAGHSIELNGIERDAWMSASRRAHLADYGPMARCIAGALGSSGLRSDRP